MRIIWTKELYGTGVEEIDSQHRELFDRINKVMEMIERGATRQEVGGMMDFLGSYVVSHFSCEEKIMEKRKCSTCPLNKTAHGQFLKEYQKLKAQFDVEGISDSFINGLKSILFPWLRSHIMTIDSKLQETRPE